MTFGSLFAGIGGFDLGLERAGMTCSWQVEINPFCQRLLARHWPNAGRWDDIRTFLREGPVQPWRVDVLCGGFPCQDISFAGKGAGIDGERSGLWREYVRIIGEVRPRYVVVENVRALVGRGLSRVLMDLARLRYDAEWQVISAAAFGASHLRERLWIVAYPHSERQFQCQRIFPECWQWSADGRETAPADPEGIVEHEPPVAETRGCPEAQRCSAQIGCIPAGGCHCGRSIPSEWPPTSWLPEPGVGRVVYGIPRRTYASRLHQQRISALGNAIVPQIAEWLGRRIIAREGK